VLAELLALIDERILRAEPLQIRAAVPQVRTQFRFSFFRAFYEFEFAGGQEIYFIDRFGKRAGKKFKAIEKKSLKVFEGYSWPGNVRELQNVVERAVILCEGETFSVEETWLKKEPSSKSVRPGPLNGVLVKQEKEIIEVALAESRGRISGAAGAAAKLGLPSRTLDSKIKRLKINKYRFKIPPRD
jgi:formate hydrogenlyase transcriptional activator